MGFTYHPIHKVWVVLARKPYHVVCIPADLLFIVNESFTTYSTVIGDRTCRVLGQVDIVDGPFDHVIFDSLQGVVVDHVTGDILITDDHHIRCVDLDSQTVSTIAGCETKSMTFEVRIRRRTQQNDLYPIDARKALFPRLYKLCMNQFCGTVYASDERNSIYRLVRKHENKALIRKSRLFDVERIYHHRPIHPDPYAHEQIVNFDLSSNDDIIITFHTRCCILQHVNHRENTPSSIHWFRQDEYSLRDIRYTFCHQQWVALSCYRMNRFSVGWIHFNDNLESKRTNNINHTYVSIATTVPTVYHNFIITWFVDQDIDPVAAEWMANVQDICLHDNHIYLCTKTGEFGVLIHCLS